MMTAKPIAPPSNIVDVWIIDTKVISETDFVEFSNCLSPAELVHIKTITYPETKAQYRNTRILTRRILSTATNIPSSEIILEKTKLGRPYISNAPDPIDFNISHSDGYFMIAISNNSHFRVGVDIEVPRLRQRQDQIAVRHFSKAELTYYQNQKNKLARDDVFLCFWTLKEAMSKALGVGLSSGLKHYNFNISDKNNIMILSDKAQKQENYIAKHKVFNKKQTYHAAISIMLLKPHINEGMINALNDCNIILKPYTT